MSEPVANVNVAADISLGRRGTVTQGPPGSRAVLADAAAENQAATARAGGKGPGSAEGRGGPDEEAVRRLLRRLHLVSTYSENVRLSFQVHAETGRIMLRVLDAETGETLKEIPPEEYLDVMGRIAGFVGAVLDRRA